MGIVINTLLPSLNAQGQINKNERSYKKSISKLASGYKINKSADDASGLAMSEKMRNKITALDTDSMNCEDGINLLQVADGAMQEINDILQRCTVLAGKAANGTLDDEERQIIQDEIDELHAEIFRIKDNVKFNEKNILQDGDNVVIKGKMPAWADMDADSIADGVLSQNNNGCSASTIDISSFSPADISSSVGTGFHTTCCTCDEFYSIEFTDEPTSSVENSGQNYIYKVGLDGAVDAQDVFNRIQSVTGNPINGHNTALSFDNGVITVYDRRPGQKPDYDNNMGLIGGGSAYQSDRKAIDLSFKIGDTSTSADKLKVNIPSISPRKLGLPNVDVTHQEGASKAIGVYRHAGQIISEARGAIGAYQNRLEHTINNLTQTSENTTESRSRIMDTDMAKESTELAKFSILNQSSQAMLAQANSQPEGILSLIQQQ